MKIAKTQNVPCKPLKQAPHWIPTYHLPVGPVWTAGLLQCWAKHQVKQLAYCEGYVVNNDKSLNIRTTLTMVTRLPSETKGKAGCPPCFLLYAEYLSTFHFFFLQDEFLVELLKRRCVNIWIFKSSMYYLEKLFQLTFLQALWVILSSVLILVCENEYNNNLNLFSFISEAELLLINYFDHHYFLLWINYSCLLLVKQQFFCFLKTDFMYNSRGGGADGCFTEWAIWYCKTARRAVSVQAAVRRWARWLLPALQGTCVLPWS